MSRSGVLFLPGLGGDRDMFLPTCEHLRRMNFAHDMTYFENRPPLSRQESLPEYVARQFREQGLAGREFACLAGCSMGGMVAQEALAQGLVRTKGLVLVSTGFSGRDITPAGRLLGGALSRFPKGLGGAFISAVAFLYPYARFRTPHARLFANMLRRCPVELALFAPRMLANWRRGASGEEMLAPLPANTFHLHGRRDPLISFRSVSRLRKPESPGEGENHLTANHRPGEIARAILGAVGG